MFPIMGINACAVPGVLIWVRRAPPVLSAARSNYRICISWQLADFRQLVPHRHPTPLSQGQSAPDDLSLGKPFERPHKPARRSSVSYALAALRDPRRSIVPKCKSVCPQRLSPAVSIHLSSFAMSASLFRDASEGAEMHNHLVRERPLGHAEMTRTEFIMLAAGWSAALVAVLIRLIGIG